jgi:ubiquitin carboxyl-terminal hydrolase 5/13
MANDAVLPVIRRCMSTFKVPGPGDRVLKDECAYSFDTPESPEGLFLNVATLTAVSDRFLALDRRRSGAAVYLHQKWVRIPKPKGTEGEGAEANAGASGAGAGGEATTAKSTSSSPPASAGVVLDKEVPYEIVKTHSIAVFTGPAEDTTSRVLIPYPSPQASSLPEFLQTCLDGILAHEDASKAAQPPPAFLADDHRQTSIYSIQLVQLENGKKISPNPADWACDADGCDKRENLWLNLSDGFIGCGRRQPDGSGGNGHALSHFKDTGSCFPLCVKLGTITPKGADVYSYAPDEDDMVDDPHLGE